MSETSHRPPQFLVWSTELETFIHVTKQEADRILAIRPDWEFRNEVFGKPTSSIYFLQRKES
jgi:hypothetical protein